MTGFVNSLGLRMIAVTGGRFDAWTPSMARYTAQVSAGERPEAAFGQNRPHVGIPVEVAPFHLSQFPVTNALYRRFVEETGHRQPCGELITFHWEPVAETAPWEDPDFSGDDLPVTGVLDEDARAFCAWLSEREGRAYRIPTIHEHECATRAGTDTLYHWGEHPDARRMNYGVSLIGHPTPVGSYPANSWGFHDLLGNVWEICSDGDGSLTRGGAFNSPQHMTGADVFGSFKYGELRLLSVGFRVACDAGGIDNAEPAPAPATDTRPPISAARPAGPDVPHLDITVGDRIDLGTLPGNAAQFIVTRRGTMILCDRRSTDGGTTWEPAPPLSADGAYGQLRDGTVMQVAGQARFADPREGAAALEVSISTDEWRTVETFSAPLHVPLASTFIPVRGFLELPDGRILITLYGNLEGDRVWTASPVAAELIHRYNWFKNRVIVAESDDRGRSWRFLATVCYHPELTPMGSNESDLIALADGRLFAAMRSGIHGHRDLHGRAHLDQPLLTAWSADGGRTWTDPQRVYVDGELIPGIYPRLLLTGGGVLAVLRARGVPGGSVVFSPDGQGSVWSDQVVHFDGAYASGQPYHCGMQDMALIGPDTILVIDVISRDGFPPRQVHAEGVPITVRKVSSHG